MLSQMYVSLQEKLAVGKFYENPIRVRRDDPCRRADTQTDGRTDRKLHMTMFVVDFRNFANAPKTEKHIGQSDRPVTSYTVLEFVWGN